MDGTIAQLDAIERVGEISFFVRIRKSQKKIVFPVPPWQKLSAYYSISSQKYPLSFPDKNIAIVCNPLAGVGRALRLAQELVAILKSKSIKHQSFSNAWPDNFSGFTAVWIVGGDGTLNYFINAYPDIDLPLVIFKGGTGNDFHWLLYGSKTVQEQTVLVLNCTAKKVDLGKCNNKFFINGVGIGFEGEIVKQLTGKKKLPGKISFYIAVLKNIFFYKAASYNIKISGNDLTGEKLIVSITNGRRVGGGFHIAPEAATDDGLFDVIIVENIPAIKRLRYLPVIEKGKHLHLPFVKYLQLKELTIESNKPISAHLDGEYYTTDSMNIKILPGKLSFIY